LNGKEVHAGGVAARSIEARYQAELDWVTAHAKHDRDRRSGSLSHDRGVGRTGSSDHPHAAANEIGRQLRQAIVLAFRPPILYRQILALDVSGVSAVAAPPSSVNPPRRRSAA
jgi:hypothetical protein